MLKNWIKWFPVLLFLSVMSMPQVLIFSSVSKTFIPMLLILWLIAINIEWGIRLPKKGVFIMSFLLLGQSFVWLTGDMHTTGIILLGVTWTVLAFLVYVAMDRVKGYLDTYMYSYIAVAVLWMVAAGIVWFGFTDGSALSIAGIALTHVAQVKPAGSFANGNVFGMMMLCAWLMSTKYWLDKQRHSSWMGILAFLFLCWVFASMSRGAWVAGFPILLGIYFRLLQSKRWHDVGLLTLSMLLAWWVAGWMVEIATLNTSLQNSAEDIASLGVRLVLYPAEFAVWKDHWLFGVGLGNLIAFYLTGQAQVLSTMPQDVQGLLAVDSGHNHLLYMLACAGIAGLLAWLSVTYILWKLVWLNRFDMSSKAWLPVSLAVMLWIQGLFNITLNEALPFFLFFIFLGLARSLQRGFKKERNTLLMPKRLWMTVAVFGVLILSFYSYQTTKAWTLYEEMTKLEVASERGKLVSELFAMNLPNVYPRVMWTVVYDFMIFQEGDVQAWGNILPNIEYALTIEGWPELYQGLFYTYMLQEKWDKACSVGQFIRNQHWDGEQNAPAYEKACQSQSSTGYMIGFYTVMEASTTTGKQ